MQLPPESFDLTDYTSRSDVWALGVLMWEIFSCGTEPELPKGVFSNRESSLGQLLKPEFCPTIVYRAITLCWARDPWSRPSFQDLKEYLNCAIEIHQLAKGTNKSRSERPSDDLGELFVNDIPYDKEVATPDISDTCL
ncbi:Inactive tyrosine-protein kinase 7 [Holothuria leucospilota]|uniref:Inactive tyrosine-protein kinase 7 n=1 Tax=Holothuria leucospilota TaxID=206669 RepID=A0A9Q1BZM0_HOLLE|nr:Inactive tyrosine-protein kinase 7 [Holothuria leucospilota]